MTAHHCCRGREGRLGRPLFISSTQTFARFNASAAGEVNAMMTYSCRGNGAQIKLLKWLGEPNVEAGNS